MADDVKETKQKEVKQKYEIKCHNETDFLQEKINANDENVYTIGLGTDKSMLFYCFTKEEIKRMITYKKPVDIHSMSLWYDPDQDENDVNVEAESENLPFVEQVEDDEELFYRQSHRKFWLYKIDFFNVIVDNTFYELIKNNVKHIILIDTGKKIKVFRSYTRSGVHDLEITLYKAKKIETTEDIYEEIEFDCDDPKTVKNALQKIKSMWENSKNPREGYLYLKCLKKMSVEETELLELTIIIYNNIHEINYEKSMLFSDIILKTPTPTVFYEDSLLIEKYESEQKNISNIEHIHILLHLYIGYIRMRDQDVENPKYKEDMLRIKNKIINDYYLLEEKKLGKEKSSINKKYDDLKGVEEILNEPHTFEELKELADDLERYDSIRYKLTSLEIYCNIWNFTKDSDLIENMEKCINDIILIYSKMFSFSSFFPNFENSDDENSDDENYYHNLD